MYVRSVQCSSATIPTNHVCAADVKDAAVVSAASVCTVHGTFTRRPSTGRNCSVTVRIIGRRVDFTVRITVVKIDCSKRLAFLLHDFKLIINQQQLISKTDTYDAILYSQAQKTQH